jgi:hypothetical protein
VTGMVILPIISPAVGFEPTEPLLKINELRMMGHIGTHEMWNELNEVAEKWPNLPKEIRDAILAIVRSTKET